MGGEYGDVFVKGEGDRREEREDRRVTHLEQAVEQGDRDEVEGHHECGMHDTYKHATVDDELHEQG